MYEKIIRNKLRFDSGKGLLTVEDLWDLPLTGGKASLDEVAKTLYRQLKSGDDVSFVTPAQMSDETVQLKFDVVKRIIDVRLLENAAAATARANKEKKQRLLAIIDQKENEALLGTSLDELKAMVAAM